MNIYIEHPEKYVQICVLYVEYEVVKQCSIVSCRICVISALLPTHILVLSSLNILPTANSTQNVDE